MTKSTRAPSRQRRLNTVRIIGGSHRTRKIHFPDAPGLRPTSDRIRETLFNWLRQDMPGARCLDLFAGSGALGFESLSRGGAFVEFVELNPQAKTSLTESLAALAMSNAAVHCEDARRWIARNNSTDKVFDIVFLDPPFAENLLPQVCSDLAHSTLLKPGSKIYIETDAAMPEVEVPAGWQLLKNKRAGNVNFRLYVVSGS